MSSKTAPDETGDSRRRAWSLAARLTAWYAVSSFALILAATGFLYWILDSNLGREGDQLLADEVRVLRSALVNHPRDTEAIRWEAEEEWQARQHTQLFVRIIDGDGRVVVETPGMARTLPVAFFPEPADEAGAGIDLPAANGRSFRVQAVRADVSPPRASPGVIQVAMDRTQQVQVLAEYRRNLWFVLGAALLLCAAAGYRIARRGMRPIHDITATAGRTGPTNLGERITPGGLPAELLTLADTFNRMLDRLEQSFARLSRFSADIAHELRTPLHSLRGEAELALSKPRTPEEYRDVLGSNLEECGRLIRLVENLLFLARAENPKTQVARERFDARRELAAVCEFYEATAVEAGVRLVPDAGEPLLIELNRALFGRAVSNLVANALEHTPAGGTVTVSASGDDTVSSVVVADTGRGIPPEDLPHVFDRFYRADPARASGGGVGLGLAIVKSVVDLHSGSVEVGSDRGTGTRVTLTFPKG